MLAEFGGAGSAGSGSKEWHCEFMGQIEGPFREDQIKEMIRSRKLTAQSLVWSSSLGYAERGWVKASDTELAALFSETIPMLQEFPAWKPPRDYSDYSEPAYVPTLRAGSVRGAATKAEESFAEPKLRLIAFVTDLLLSSIIALAVMIIFGSVVMLLFRLEFGASFMLGVLSMLGFRYEAVLLAIGILAATLTNVVLLSRNGQTFGKKIAKVRVVKTSGRKISFFRNIVIRSLVKLAFIVPPLIFIDLCFLLRKDGRTLHDIIGGTIVVNTA